MNTWYVESVTIEIEGVSDPIDLLTSPLVLDDIPACSHDNLFLFLEDGTVTMDAFNKVVIPGWSLLAAVSQPSA